MGPSTQGGRPRAWSRREAIGRAKDSLDWFNRWDKLVRVLLLLSAVGAIPLAAGLAETCQFVPSILDDQPPRVRCRTDGDLQAGIVLVIWASLLISAAVILPLLRLVRAAADQVLLTASRTAPKAAAARQAGLPNKSSTPSQMPDRPEGAFTVEFALSIKPATFDELVARTELPEDAVHEQLDELIDQGLVTVQEGRFVLSKDFGR